MSKFEQIEAFLHVVHENSFVAAARKLGVSTAAISRQISKLEADLGAQLLARTTRQISLTEIGNQYYKSCKNALTELNEAEAAINQSRAEPTGEIHLISNRYFANEYLLPYLAEFMATYPKLIPHIELAERFPNFNIEKIDILFGVSFDGAPNLVRKRIATTRYVLCASPDYLKKYGTPASPDELIHHRYITHIAREPNNMIQFRHDKKIYVQPTLYLNDSQAMLESAIQSIGFVLLHNYVARNAINKGLLTELFSELQEPENPIYLYYQQQRYLQPKIRHCIDFFTQKLK